MDDMSEVIVHNRLNEHVPSLEEVTEEDEILRKELQPRAHLLAPKATKNLVTMPLDKGERAILNAILERQRKRFALRYDGLDVQFEPGEYVKMPLKVARLIQNQRQDALEILMDVEPGTPTRRWDIPSRMMRTYGVERIEELDDEATAKHKMAAVIDLGSQPGTPIVREIGESALVR